MSIYEKPEFRGLFEGMYMSEFRKKPGLSSKYEYVAVLSTARRFGCYLLSGQKVAIYKIWLQRRIKKITD
jgi:hypothetical protein